MNAMEKLAEIEQIWKDAGSLTYDELGWLAGQFVTLALSEIGPEE